MIVKVKFIFSCWNEYLFANFKGIVDILGLPNFRAIKRIALISLQSKNKGSNFNNDRTLFVLSVTMVYKIKENQSK